MSIEILLALSVVGTSVLLIVSGVTLLIVQKRKQRKRGNTVQSVRFTISC